MSAELLSKLRSLKRSIQGLKRELEYGIEREVEAATLEMTEKTKKRIISKGQNAYKKNSNYRDKKWIGKRKKAGLQVGYKDLYFTGGMLNSLSAQEPKEKKEGIVSFTMAVSSEYEDRVDKLSQQEKLTGDNKVLDATEKELKAAQERVEKYIARIIKKYKI